MEDKKTSARLGSVHTFELRQRLKRIETATATLRAELREVDKAAGVDLHALIAEALEAVGPVERVSEYLLEDLTGEDVPAPVALKLSGNMVEIDTSGDDD